MGRILQNNNPNFLHGHHAGRTGVAYYGTWVTPQDVPGNTDWLVMCGNNQGVVFVGNGRSNIAVRHGALQNAADFNFTSMRASPMRSLISVSWRSSRGTEPSQKTRCGPAWST